MRHRRFLTAFVGIFLFLLQFFLWTPKAQAIDLKTGTHLYNFDPGGQLKALQKLAENASKLPSPYPVVLMISANNPADYAPLAQAATKAPFFPIIRIIDAKPDTDPNKMVDVANFIKANFPSGAPVELANEIENSSEWPSPDYTRYGQMFNVLAANLPEKEKFPLGIAALNTSNADVDAKRTLVKVVLSLSLSSRERINAVFANVYQLSGCKYEEDRCNINAGQWYLDQINKQLGKSLTTNELYITEFGNVTCTSYDCVQDFYKTNANLPAKYKVGFTSTPGSGTNNTAEFQHTVPDLCEYWKLNDLSVSKPKSCSNSGDLYIYPGIDDQKDTSVMFDMASRYMMTCAPKFTFSGSVINESDINNTSKNDFIPIPLDCSSGQCTVTADGTLFINHEQTTIPLFRFDKASVPNNSSASRRLDDLEGLFSSRYAGDLNDPKSFLGSGNETKSNGQVARCNSTLQFLESIKTLCANQPKEYNRINHTPGEEPEPLPEKPVSTNGVPPKCPLDLQVPDLNESYLEILASKPSSFTCDQAQSPISTYQDFATKLASVETTTPRAFKPAYIVHYTNYPSSSDTFLNNYAQWFALDGKKPEIDLETRVRVTKVFVPANVASTTKDTPTIPGTFEYTSGLMSSILSNVSVMDQTKINNKQAQDIKNIVETNKEQGEKMINPASGTTRYIDCWECDQKSFIATIVKRINAEIHYKTVTGSDQYNFDCNKLDAVGEKAKERKSLVNPAGNPDPVHEIGITTTAKLTVGKNKGDDLFTRTFMLLPEEYRNISDYEDLLARSFTSSEENKDVFPEGMTSANTTTKLGKSYKFLQLGDTAPKLASGGTTIHMSSPKREGIQIGTRVAGSLSGPVYLEGQILGTGNETFDVNPLVPGGRLARGLFEIICHAALPLNPGKSPAQYEGFEKILQQGTSACFKSPTTPTTATPLCKPPEAVLVCKNFRPGQEAHSLTSFTPSATEQENACSSTEAGGTGIDASITSGVAALALRVSKVTCVPAEVLIGVMAKESKGYKDDANTPFSGDTQEIFTRNNCDGINNKPCGPYQYQQGYLDNQIAKYGDDIRPCLAALSLSDQHPDTRMLGISMCVAAAHMSRGSTCSTTNAKCSTAPSLSDWSPQQINNAVMVFHANACGINATTSIYSDALVNYLGFIDQYKYLVQSTRALTAGCP